MKHDRRQEIITSAMELFAKKGFRGTTTRDLATHAEINEAIIFRYFKTKEELYSAIIEHKAGEGRDARIAEFEHLANVNDDEKFFQAVGNAFLEKHETDTTFLRLLLFSALEGHELSEMFVSSVTPRHPIATYIQQRIDEGAFRQMDAHLAARALLSMFAGFVLWQEIFGLKKKHPRDREEVVRTFVSIFLSGVTKKEGNSGTVSNF
jgi:AcrR family transcriptional regulator